MNLSALSSVPILALMAWVIAWKGLALWNAAKNSQRNWFMAILALNGITVGILEIIYLFRFAKKKMTLDDLQFWKSKS